MRQLTRYRCMLLLLSCAAFNLAVWNYAHIFVKRNVSSPIARHRIPKILHQVSESEMVFSQYSRTIESCLRLNPDWTYVLWRDADAEALIRDYFPLFYRDQYSKYTNQLQKSDSVRYIILYLFGGLYLDMDVECRKPFFPTLADETCFLDQENRMQTRIYWDLDKSAMNSAMGCRPGHPFMLSLIYRMRLSGSKQGPMESTGPMMLTSALNDWVRNPAHADRDSSVRLVSPELFSPYVDKKEHLMKICQMFSVGKVDNSQLLNGGLWISRGCRQLEQGGLFDSFSERTVAVHWFMHLGWYKPAEMAGMSRFNISRKLGRVKFYSGPGGAQLQQLINPSIVGQWLPVS